MKMRLNSMSMVFWSKTPATLPMWLAASILSVTPKMAAMAFLAAASPMRAVHMGAASFKPAIVAAESAAFVCGVPSALYMRLKRASMVPWSKAPATLPIWLAASILSVTPNMVVIAACAAGSATSAALKLLEDPGLKPPVLVDYPGYQ